MVEHKPIIYTDIIGSLKHMDTLHCGQFDGRKVSNGKTTNIWIHLINATKD